MLVPGRIGKVYELGYVALNGTPIMALEEWRIGSDNDNDPYQVCMPVIDAEFTGTLFINAMHLASKTFHFDDRSTCTISARFRCEDFFFAHCRITSIRELPDRRMMLHVMEFYGATTPHTPVVTDT